MQLLQQDAAFDAILAELESALTRWYSGDLLGYAELFADDATYFDLMTQSRLEGATALRQHYAPFQGKLQVPRFEVVSPQLRIHGDVGIFTYRLHEFMTEGSPSRAFHTTEVYRQTGGRWRIVHAHWSAVPGIT